MSTSSVSFSGTAESSLPSSVLKLTSMKSSASRMISDSFHISRTACSASSCDRASTVTFFSSVSVTVTSNSRTDSALQFNDLNVTPAERNRGAVAVQKVIQLLQQLCVGRYRLHGAVVEQGKRRNCQIACSVHGNQALVLKHQIERFALHAELAGFVHIVDDGAVLVIGVHIFDTIGIDECDCGVDHGTGILAIVPEILILTERGLADGGDESLDKVLIAGEVVNIKIDNDISVEGDIYVIHS